MKQEYLFVSKEDNIERLLYELCDDKSTTEIEELKRESLKRIKFEPVIFNRKQFLEAKQKNPQGLPNSKFYRIEKGKVSLANYETI